MYFLIFVFVQLPPDDQLAVVCPDLCFGKDLLLVYVIVLLLATWTAVCPGRFWNVTVAVQGQSPCHIVLTQCTPAVGRSQPRRPARECANCTVVVRWRQAVDFGSEMAGSVGFSVWLQPMIMGLYKRAHLCLAPKWENINFLWTRNVNCSAE